MYATLLIDLFKFLAPFLRNAELTKPAQLLYKVSQSVQSCTQSITAVSSMFSFTYDLLSVV